MEGFLPSSSELSSELTMTNFLFRLTACRGEADEEDIFN